MSDKANFPCEMHAHTNYSDGNDTPYEFVENAARRGLKVVVICDHDVIPPAEVVKPDGPKEEICHYAAARGSRCSAGSSGPAKRTSTTSISSGSAATGTTRR